MKKKKKWIKWVVILVIVAAVIGWFMMVSRKTQDVAYTDVQATLGSIETYYNFDGLVKAKRVQTITAAQSDKVRTVYVTQNQQVKKGERLYRLEGGETVEADIAGEVTGLYVEQGGVVTAGETTVQIIDMNSLEIELNVDEYDVAAVVPGQAVGFRHCRRGVVFVLFGEIRVVSGRNRRHGRRGRQRVVSLADVACMSSLLGKGSAVSVCRGIRLVPLFILRSRDRPLVR